jgi:hypothetical protein
VDARVAAHLVGHVVGEEVVQRGNGRRARIGIMRGGGQSRRSRRASEKMALVW